jgi:hypothetical protein
MTTSAWVIVLGAAGVLLMLISYAVGVERCDRWWSKATREATERAGKSMRDFEGKSERELSRQAGRHEAMADYYVAMAKAHAERRR